MNLIGKDLEIVLRALVSFYLRSGLIISNVPTLNHHVVQKLMPGIANLCQER